MASAHCVRSIHWAPLTSTLGCIVALCTPFSRCAICKVALGNSTNVLGFPDLVPMFSEFGEFYDACVHAECMRNWSRRDEFVRYYNSLVDTSTLGAAWRLVILPTGYVTSQGELDRGAA